MAAADAPGQTPTMQKLSGPLYVCSTISMNIYESEYLWHTCYVLDLLGVMDGPPQVLGL